MTEYKNGDIVFWVGEGAWHVGVIIWISGSTYGLPVMWAGLAVAWVRLIQGRLLIRKSKRLLDSITAVTNDVTDQPMA